MFRISRNPGRLLDTFIKGEACSRKYDHFCWLSYSWRTQKYMSTCPHYFSLGPQSFFTSPPPLPPPPPPQGIMQRLTCACKRAYTYRLDRLHKQDLHRSTLHGPLAHVFKIRWQPHLDLPWLQLFFMPPGLSGSPLVRFSGTIKTALISSLCCDHKTGYYFHADNHIQVLLWPLYVSVVFSHHFSSNPLANKTVPQLSTSTKMMRLLPQTHGRKKNSLFCIMALSIAN